jgi:hypothetical protein
MIVVFDLGTVEVVDGRVRVSSTDEASRAVSRALRGRYVSEGTPRIATVEGNPGVIVEGEIRKLRRGTVEHTEAALRSLPGAIVLPG